MTVRDDIAPVQHPLARILELIGELKDATYIEDQHDRDEIAEMWDVLENLIVMVVSQRNTPDLLHKAALYDQIAAMIRPYIQRQEETPHVDPDAKDRGRTGDRGSDQS